MAGVCYHVIGSFNHYLLSVWPYIGSPMGLAYMELRCSNVASQDFSIVESQFMDISKILSTIMSVNGIPTHTLALPHYPSSSTKLKLPFQDGPMLEMDLYLNFNQSGTWSGVSGFCLRKQFMALSLGKGIWQRVKDHLDKVVRSLLGAWFCWTRMVRMGYGCGLFGTKGLVHLGKYRGRQSKVDSLQCWIGCHGS